MKADKRQDKDGQWWYHSANWRRRRLLKRTCPVCGKVEWVGRKRVNGCCLSCSNTASRNPNWRGGKWRAKNGYMISNAPNHPYVWNNRCVSYSKLVMEKHLGRYLTTEEVVHHINGIKDDDRIENLWLFATTGEHSLFHAFLRKRERKQPRE